MNETALKQQNAQSPMFAAVELVDSSDFAENIVLSPGLWIARNGEIPDAIAGEVAGVEAFSERMPNLWLRDPLTGMLVPYWLSIPLQQILATSLRGVLPRCPKSILPWLQEARIALPPNALGANQDYNKTHHQVMLEKRKYSVFRNLFPAPVLRNLSAHMRYLQQNGQLTGCDQVVKRSRVHNDMIMRFFHNQLEAYLNKVMVEKIKASYVFSVIYHEAAVLERHTDRPQCRWNFSLPVGYTPDATYDTTWPIYLEINGKPLEIRLMPGDAVLYSGTDIPHWRDAQPSGRESIVSFFHFVSADFEDELA